MKNNIVKYLLALSLVFFFTSCGDDDDRNDFTQNPNLGWVEFETGESILAVPLTSVSIPLDIRVPVFKNGLNISYSMEPIEGDFTQFVTNATTGNIFIDPSEPISEAGLDLNLKDLGIDRDFNTVFKIVITAVDVTGVTVGVDGDSNIEHVITFPPFVAPLVPNDFFLGDYTIADVAGTVGPGNGTENFEGGTVTLSIDTGDQNRRLFNVGVLSAFNAEIENVSIAFTSNDVRLGDDVDPNLTCGGGVPYIFTSLASGNTPWDINTGDDDIIIVQYTEDPQGSCGGPFSSSFSLTKN